MKKLLTAVIFTQFSVLGSDVFEVDDIKVKCNCEKDKSKWQTETLDDVNWIQKINVPHPDIRDVIIIESRLEPGVTD